MCDYLDPDVIADQCGRYVDDIVIAAKNATDLTQNIRAVFECICRPGLKLTIEKCHFVFGQVKFPGKVISGFTKNPQNPKFPQQSEILQIKKGLATLLAFRKSLQKIFFQGG